MKRQYMAPDMEILEISMEEMIATSSVTSNNGLDYGGVDEEGEKDAESRAPIDFFMFE